MLGEKPRESRFGPGSKCTFPDPSGSSQVVIPVVVTFVSHY